MCTVQVLITADVMRSLRRNVMVRPSRESICRKLFCEQDDPLAEDIPVDTQTAYRKLQNEMSTKARLRWNFDFFEERPLPGRYQWVPVSAPTGPLASRTEEPVTSRTEASVRAEVRTEDQIVAEDCIEASVVAEVRIESEGSKTEGTTCKQSKITDFLQSRKRTRKNSTSIASPTPKKIRRTHTTNCNTSEESSVSNT